MTKEERRIVCWQNAQKCRKYNSYREEGDVVYVKLDNTQNEMICDKDDWKYLKNYKWIESEYGYCLTWINRHTTRCHKLIMGNKDGYVIDHINKNKLDNRKCNLRFATSHANNINTSLSKANKSGHKGVCKTKSGKWHAYIGLNRKMINLGKFENIQDAIEARKRAEEKYYCPIIKEETQ